MVLITGYSEEDAQDHQRGPDEDPRTHALAEPLGEQIHDLVHRPVQREDTDDPDDDRDEDHEAAVGVLVAEELERGGQEEERDDRDRERCGDPQQPDPDDVGHRARRRRGQRGAQPMGSAPNHSRDRRPSVVASGRSGRPTAAPSAPHRSLVADS